MTHTFRVFAAHHEFIVEASFSGGHPGRLSGPPEDCFPSECPDVAIEDIQMTLGTRKKALNWDAINTKAQDKIIDDILEQYENGVKAEMSAEAAEHRYDAHMDR